MAKTGQMRQKWEGQRRGRVIADLSRGLLGSPGGRPLRKSTARKWLNSSHYVKERGLGC